MNLRKASKMNTIKIKVKHSCGEQLVLCGSPIVKHSCGEQLVLCQSDSKTKLRRAAHSVCQFVSRLLVDS